MLDGLLDKNSIATAVAALMIVGLCFFAFARTYWVWYLNHLRRQGLDKRQPTLFDVRAAIQKGEKQAAVRLYQQIFKVQQPDALKAVEDLEKSMNSPNER